MKAGEAKRSSFNTRLRTEVKDQLSVEASNSGRSLSEEIEWRLEQSLLEKDTKYKEFGDKQHYELGRMLMWSVIFVEDFTGKSWWEDDATLDEVLTAVSEFFKRLGQTRARWPTAELRPEYGQRAADEIARLIEKFDTAGLMKGKPLKRET